MFVTLRARHVHGRLESTRADIIHLTKRVDLVNWDYQSTLPLEHHKVIDPGVLHSP